MLKKKNPKTCLKAGMSKRIAVSVKTKNTNMKMKNFFISNPLLKQLMGYLPYLISAVATAQGWSILIARSIRMVRKMFLMPCILI